MNTEMFFAFSAGMFILAVTPGPGVIGAVSKALSGGFKASLLFIAGLAIGDTIFFLLALGGMSAISKEMGNIFSIVKIAGGAYLFYLGIKMFKSETIKIAIHEKQNTSKLKTFGGGLILTLGNPKPILFYASILPAIINLNAVKIVDALAMICAIVLVSFIVLGSYSFLAAISGSVLTKRTSQIRVNRASGVIMCSTGTYIALK